MEPGQVASLAGGVALAAVVSLDVFFTVIHPDIEGAIARVVQRSVWEGFALVARRWEARRRGVLAMAGPAIIAATFFVWVALFILAFALLFYSGLEWYRAESELQPLTFLDALYYAGTTVTVLGYGDITPIHGAYKLLAAVAAGAGFALLTGAVAYLIEVTSSIDERYRFALRVHDEAEGSGQGVGLVLAGIEAGDVAYLRDRLEQLATDVRLVQDKAHRYALVALYYRSRDPAYDFEPAVRVASEAAVAGHLLAEDPGWAGIAPAVGHLAGGLTRLMETTAEQYLGGDIAAQLREARAGGDDRRLIEGIADQLRQAGPTVPSEPTSAALRLATRSRIFLQGMDRITAWTAESKAAMAPPP